MPTTLNQNPWTVEKGVVQRESNAGWATGLSRCVLCVKQDGKIGGFLSTTLWFKSNCFLAPPEVEEKGAWHVRHDSRTYSSGSVRTGSACNQLE